MNKKKDNYQNEAPPPILNNNIKELNNIYYNCDKCSSLIEIISINEDTDSIEFKCLNEEKKHGKRIIKIKEYIENMKKYNQKSLNSDICNIHNHNNIFASYCLDCNCHLCNDCLKTRTHINHQKINIIEIMPIQEELNIIKEVIADYNTKIEKLKN